MGKLHLYRERVSAGSVNDVIDGAWERYKEGGRESLANAWTDELTDRILKRYEDKIRNAFERAGVEIGEGEKIDKSWLTRRMSETLDMQIDDITPDAIMGAIDKSLAARLSEVLRVPVSTVMNMEQLKNDVKEGVILALQDGRAADLIFDTAVAAARKYATWKKHGEGLDKKAVANALAQKRYRRTHKLTWI